MTHKPDSPLSDAASRAAHKQYAVTPKRPKQIIPGHLELVDFENPKVIEAIRKAAEKFDEEKYKDRLEQFETRCTAGLLEYID